MVRIYTRFILFTLAVILLLLMSNCNKKEDNKEAKYVTFTVNGVPRTFNTSTSFDRICAFSTFCNGFFLDESKDDRNMFYIGLPANAHEGMIYTQVDKGFLVYYLDENGIKYETAGSSPFTLNITRWEGNDGWASGTFHGILDPADETAGLDSISITNGSFESKIYYVIK